MRVRDSFNLVQFYATFSQLKLFRGGSEHEAKKILGNSFKITGKLGVLQCIALGKIYVSKIRKRRLASGQAITLGQTTNYPEMTIPGKDSKYRGGRVFLIFVVQ